MLAGSLKQRMNRQRITIGQFFASPIGVCVYVQVDSKSIRVEFDSPSAIGVAPGAGGTEALDAIATARAALVAQGEQLTPLFHQVAAELSSLATEKT